MNSRWLSEVELKSILTKIDKQTKVEKSGVPLTFDDDNIYVDQHESHNMVIGATGSGKTQSITLPELRLSIMANESFVVNDMKGELYTKLSGELKKQNYNVLIYNLDDPTLGNGINPLYPAYDLYKRGKQEKALEMVENIAYYLLAEKKATNADPFWENSTINYFTGLVIYLFENANKEEINFNSIIKLSSDLMENEELRKKVLESHGKASALYVNLAGTLLAPPETRGSIISVFNQKMRLVITRSNLCNMLSQNDYDISKITEEKTAVFIISGFNAVSNFLTPMLINLIYDVINIYTNKKTINIIVDEFGSLAPFRNILDMLKNSRSIGIRFTLLFGGFLELNNSYGKETAEWLKYYAPKIIYLNSGDYETLEDISKMCGMETDTNKLIGIEELKQLKMFEAVVLIPRSYPIKTKLVPDYMIPWDHSEESLEIKKLEQKEIKLFQA